MDLKGFLRGENPFVEGRGFAGIAQGPPKAPIIAAVEGWALAGGFEIALACDLIVASREATFGLPEVKRGLVAGAGGLLRLPRRLPYHVAMELALTADSLDAETAHRYGLVNTLTEPGGALEGALALAAKLTANGPLALAATKEIISQSRDWSEAEGWPNQAAIMGPGVRLRGCPRRPDRLRRKAATSLERPLTHVMYLFRWWLRSGQVKVKRQRRYYQGLRFGARFACYARSCFAEPDEVHLSRPSRGALRQAPAR